MRTVTILLTKYSGCFSWFISGISKYHYSHASISIDDNEEIGQFLTAKEQYKYSCFVVVLCLLHIPHKFKNSYFCSQFVAEVLAKAGAIELKKKESLYLPGQLIDGVEYLFSGRQIIYDAI